MIGEWKSSYNFPSTSNGADTTLTVEKQQHTTEEIKEEKPSLDHIRAAQNLTAHPQGLSNPFGAPDPNLNDILVE